MHVECYCILPHECWYVCVHILGVTALCLCPCDTERRIIVGAGDGTVEVVRELDSVALLKSAAAHKVRTPSVPRLQAVSNWALLPEYCVRENVCLGRAEFSLDSPQTRVAFRSIADTVEKNEMVGACSMYRQKERHIQGFGWETWVKDTTWETQT